MGDPLRSTKTSQTRPDVAAHKPGQWSEHTILRSTMIRSSPGTASNRGAAAGPQATVTRAPGWHPIRWSRSPVDRMASPTRVEVMNRILIKIKLFLCRFRQAAPIEDLIRMLYVP